MNQQILDTPFDDEINFLEEGETILWKSIGGKKLKKNKAYNQFKMFGLQQFQGLILVIIISAYLIFNHLLLFIFLALMIFVSMLIFYFGKKNGLDKLEYYITQKRIIYRYPSGKKSEIFSIERSNLLNINLEKHATHSSINFEVNNQPTSEILTRKFLNGKSRIIGELENIEDAEKAFQILESTK